MSETKIEFVNHACAIIDTGDARILCDPWLTGRAFDNGWEPIVPADVTIADLDFSHLWISHEHPDHFSPRDLRALAAERIATTPLVYQQTKDRKVVEFCRSLGYRTLEIEPQAPVFLTASTEITSDVVTGYDSWLLVRTPSAVILNLNDCRMWEETELAAIRNRAGAIDVLLTQFGYANWVGNAGDQEAANRAADKILGKLERQIEILEPAYVIPFASFIRYCHVENSFWNDYAVRLDDALSVCERARAKAVSMFPGDVWTLGGAPPAAAIERWRAAYAAAAERPLVAADPVSADDLRAAFIHMQKRVQEANDWDAIVQLSAEGHLPASLVHVVDLGTTFELDLVNGFTPSSAAPQLSDIRLGSQALHNVFRFNWGRGTLTINARFQASYSTLWRFLRQTEIAYANNLGWRYPNELTRDKLLSGNSFLYELVDELSAREGASPATM